MQPSWFTPAVEATKLGWDVVWGKVYFTMKVTLLVGAVIMLHEHDSPTILHAQPSKSQHGSEYKLRFV